MKRILLSIGLSLLFFSAFSQQKTVNTKTYKLKGTQWYQVDKTTNQEFEVDTSIITVKFNSALNKEKFEESHTLLKISHYNKLGFGLIQKPANLSIFEFAAQLKKDSNIVNAEINTFGYLEDDYSPNDPDIGSQWYLNAIDVPGAWNYTRGSNCTPVIVAILDAGVDWTHPDLSYGSDSYTNIYENPGEDSWTNPNDPSTGNGIDDDHDGYVDDWKGWNFFSNNNNSLGSIVEFCNTTYPFDHGTVVAGIIGAKLNNSVGVAGIAGGSNKAGVKLMSVVVDGYQYTGTLGVCPDHVPTAILPDAIIYAVDRGAKIINMSFGVSETSAIDSAISYAIDHGVTLVAGAGNTDPNGDSVSYPASNPLVISVGATNMNGQKANFSNYGTNLFISAPGVSMYSTLPNDSYGYFGNGNGTSFAAPVICGVIALMLSVNPSLTPAQIKNILSSTADETGGYTYTNGKSLELGYGQVNAKKAVEAAIGGLDISGSSLLCTSSTYSLANLPSGDTATWTANPGNMVSLSFNGNGDQVTVTKVNEGNVTLSATIPYLCDTIVLSKTVQVGSTPVSGYYYSDGVYDTLLGENSGSNTLEANTWILVNINSAISALPQWTPEGGYDYSWHIASNELEINVQSDGYAAFEMDISGECGTISDTYIFVPDGSDDYIVSPNPAQNTITITANNKSKTAESMKFETPASSTTNTIQLVKIFDISGKLRKQQIFSGNPLQVQMDISGLASGIYFVVISDGKHQETQKLVINR